MPYEDPDPTDPMMLHGMMFETDDDQAIRNMAECFIEEYFRLGFTASRIAKMFRTAGYAGPHLACRALGEQAIDSMIDEYAQRWGPRQPAQQVEHKANGDLTLPVLEQ